MGYVSAYLGQAVQSNYLHIDNLRSDLVAGKFFGPGGTKYVQISHNDTDAIIKSSYGNLLLQTTSGGTISMNGIATAVAASMKRGNYSSHASTPNSVSVSLAANAATTAIQVWWDFGIGSAGATINIGKSVEISATTVPTIDFTKTIDIRLGAMLSDANNYWIPLEIRVDGGSWVSLSSIAVRDFRFEAKYITATGGIGCENYSMVVNYQ